MEFKIVSAGEIRGYEIPRLREYQNEIRAELNSIRMDIYQAQGAQAANKRILRKNLARALTVEVEKTRAAKAKG